MGRAEASLRSRVSGVDGRRPDATADLHRASRGQAGNGSQTGEARERSDSDETRKSNAGADWRGRDSQTHKPGQDLLAEGRLHQGGFGRLLSGGLFVYLAAPSRST